MLIFGFVSSSVLSVVCAWAIVGFTAGHQFTEATAFTIILMIVSVGIPRTGLQLVRQPLGIEEPRGTLPMTAIVAGLFGAGTMLSASAGGAARCAAHDGVRAELLGTGTMLSASEGVTYAAFGIGAYVIAFALAAILARDVLVKAAAR